MPFINIVTNTEVNENAEKNIKEKFAKSIEIIPGKSEYWMMLNIQDKSKLYFRGNKDKAAYVEVKLYGDENISAYNKFTLAACEIMKEVLGIDTDRVYVSYFETHNWGYDKSNF